MNINQFHKQLMTTGNYETPTRIKRTPLDNLLGWSSTWYYIRAFLVVAYGAIIATRGRYPESWANESLNIMKAVEGCGGKINISGFENVARQGNIPMVYIANHMATAETFLIPSMLTPLNFLVTVVKESLINYPVFGRIMKAVEPISVKRENARDDLKEVLNKGTQYLAQGRSVIVFPQATRSSEFDPETFNSLGVKLAARAGVPVIPLALKTDFQGNGKLFKDIGPLDRKKILFFKFGERLDPNRENSREIHDKVVNFISENIKQWKALDNQ